MDSYAELLHRNPALKPMLEYGDLELRATDTDMPTVKRLSADIVYIMVIKCLAKVEMRRQSEEMSILPPRTKHFDDRLHCLVDFILSRGKLVSPLTQSKLADRTVNYVDYRCHNRSLKYIRNIDIG